MADNSKITLKQLKNAMTQAKNYTDNEIANITSISKVEPEEADLPKVFFTGDKPTTKDSVYATIEYISKTDHFKGYVDIKCQGTSSMAYPKKNYTIKMFTDSTKATKLKKDFKGWGKQNKFCLKANYIDCSHSRNVCSAKLWGQMVASRSDFDTLPEELKTSPNYGAVDGFFIKVYYNGDYEGLYTWNIPKDGWMNNMDDTLDTQCILCGEEYDSGCFRTANAAVWSDELHDVMPANIVTSFNNFQNFVINSTDVDFKANLSNYADINSLIDYYIFQYAICGLDSMGKNQLFFTYDGTKWLASSYDMDSTFGLYWNGQSFVSSEYRMQQDYESGIHTANTHNSEGNLLYVRLERLFSDEIKARYAELRANVLSYANIVNVFETFMAPVSKDLFTESNNLYSGIPSKDTNNITQIRNYTRDRLSYVDGKIAELSGILGVPCTGINLNKTELSLGKVEGSAAPKNYLDGIEGVESGNDIYFSNIILPKGNYVFTNINGGTFKWLNYILNGVYDNSNSDTTDVAYINCTQDTNTLTVHGYPNGLVTNTPDKLALYKFIGTENEGVEPITFTQAGQGYYDAYGNIISSDTDIYSNTVELDSNKFYIFKYIGDTAADINNLCMLLDSKHKTLPKIVNSGDEIISFTGVSSFTYSINTDYISALDKCVLVECERVYETTDTVMEELLTASLTPTNTTDTLTWSVNPTGIVTVVDGLVTAKTNGSAVITATCGTQSATCNVTVSGMSESGGSGGDAPASSPLYELPQETTFNGTSDYIDTGVALCATDQNYTILMDFTPSATQNAQPTIFHCLHEVEPYHGISMQMNSTQIMMPQGNSEGNLGADVDLPLLPIGSTRQKFAVVRNGNIIKLLTINGENKSVYTHNNVTENLLLGAYQDTDGNKGRYFTGTIHECKVYKEALSDNDIYDFIYAGINRNIEYELPQETTFNGTSDYIDTGISLMDYDSINKDWTILLDFTLNSIPTELASIFHCMTEISGYPGISLDISAGQFRIVLPNANSHNLVALTTDRIQFVITKSGNTFTVYDSNMTSLATTTTDSINITTKTLLLGAYQDLNGTKGRFINGTIHRFKITEGVMSTEDCLAWLNIGRPEPPTNNTAVFGVDATCLNTETNTLTDSVAGLNATLTGTPTLSGNQIAFTASDTFRFDISSLNLTNSNRTFRIKFTPSTLDTYLRNVIEIGSSKDANSWDCSTTSYMTSSKLNLQHGRSDTNGFSGNTVGSADPAYGNNRLPVAPVTGQEYELVISENINGNVRWYIDGTLVQDGTITLFNPLYISNAEGTNRFIGNYSLIEIYDAYCNDYTEFTNMINDVSTES